MRTLQITGDSPEAIQFFEYALSLPFVHEKRTKQKEDISPMTVEEFNGKIDRAMDDYRAGRSIPSAELKQRMASW
jgi:hypothetical protein